MTDENGDLVLGCKPCSGSGLEGFDPDSDTPHTDTTPCSDCMGLPLLEDIL